MNIYLSPAMRRALALAILLILIVLVWAAAIRPLIRLSTERRADIAELSERLAHFEMIIARRPELQRRAHAREARFAAAGGLWRGASASAIGAAVQDKLGKAAGAGGGRVDSSSEAHETVEHGFRKVTVHFSIEGSLDTVTRTLAAIETARPALFADRLTIAAPDNATAAGGRAILHFELDVSGYLAEPRS
ncbi:MAG: type II secretion system protein GspM [Stellaceae bacterium]